MWADKFQNHFMYLVWAADPGSANQALPFEVLWSQRWLCHQPQISKNSCKCGCSREKTMRQSPAKASPALDCSAAALPWPASQRIALRALFMDVPAGTRAVLGQLLFPAPTGVLVFHGEMKSPGGTGPSVCGTSWPVLAGMSLCVCWVWGAPGELEKVQKMLLTMGMDEPHPVCRWLFQGHHPSLCWTGKIKDDEEKIKASSSQGFNLNEHQHSLWCWKTYEDIKPVKCISSLFKLWGLCWTCFLTEFLQAVL